MVMRRDGSIAASNLRFEQGDYGPEFISHPVLGVILNVFCADDNLNAEARTFQDQRGTQCQARVWVINDGNDVPWILPNVIITPHSSSGFDNFSEEVPRGTNGTVDGSKFDWNLLDVPARKLNGDWCIIDFIGGSTSMPFMVTWWPHPSNRRDSTTGGVGTRVDDPRDRNLVQRRRSVKRFQGTRFAVTSQGDVFIDTSEANTVLDADGNREEMEDGGEVGVTIKQTQRLQVNFNPSVPDQVTEDGDIFQDHPDVLQVNPHPAQKIRDDLLTRLLMDKDFITALAGRVIQIAGDNDGADSDDSVLFGQTPTDHVVLGEKHQATYNELVTRLNAFEVAFEGHIHAAGSGNTSAPIDPATVESTYANLCHLVIDPSNPVFALCTDAGLTAAAGGNPFIPDPADVAAHNAIFGPLATVPPAAPGVTRVDPMPDADLSDVVKTE